MCCHSTLQNISVVIIYYSTLVLLQATYVVTLHYNYTSYTLHYTFASEVKWCCSVFWCICLKVKFSFRVNKVHGSQVHTYLLYIPLKHCCNDMPRYTAVTIQIMWILNPSRWCIFRWSKKTHVSELFLLLLRCTALFFTVDSISFETT